MASTRSTPPGGRREAHKAATRAAILEAARRLFAERGIEHTSIREIAAAAQVTERTFYRYFEAKESLLVEEATAWIASLSDEIRKRPADEPPLDAVLEAIRSMARRAGGDDRSSPFVQFVEMQRPLAALGRESTRPLRRLESAIATALAARRERGRETRTFEDEVAARVAVAAVRSAAIRHRELLAAGGTSPGIQQVLVLAFRATRAAAGLGDVASR